MKLGSIVQSLLAGAVLTIGLTEYRPFLGAAGNLSDILFFAGFLVAAVSWVVCLDAGRLHLFFQDLRAFEPFLFGGITLALGGVVASIGSSTPTVSWSNTLKYFTTFCVWLPWVALALPRYLPPVRAHFIYVAGLALVALATVSDVVFRTRFGVWLVSAAPGAAVEELVQLRYAGPVGHPTTLGYLSAIGCLLALSSAATTKDWRRGVGVLSVLAFGAAILVSGSRSALLGVFVGWLILVLLGRGYSRRHVLTLTLAFIAALLAASSIPALSRHLPVNPLARLVESVRPRRDFEADRERRRDLRSAELLLSRDPVTGYGLENVGTSATPTVGFNLHNTILQSWLAGGVLAALGTVCLYAAVLWSGVKAIRARHPLAVSLLSACVAFMLMDLVHPHLYMRFKWFAAALLFAISRDRAGSPGAPEFAVSTGCVPAST